MACNTALFVWTVVCTGVGKRLHTLLSRPTLGELHGSVLAEERQPKNKLTPAHVSKLINMENLSVVAAVSGSS